MAARVTSIPARRNSFSSEPPSAPIINRISAFAVSLLFREKAVSEEYDSAISRMERFSGNLTRSALLMFLFTETAPFQGENGRGYPQNETVLVTKERKHDNSPFRCTTVGETPNALSKWEGKFGVDFATY